MNLRRLTGLLGVLSYSVVPASLLAQVAGGVEIFGSLDNSVPVTRTLGGLSLSMGTPYLGIRGSGGIGVSSPTAQAFGNPTGSDLVWATNADLILGPVNARLGEGFMPYAFGGLGLLRVELLIDVENAASAKVAERVGYRREGVLRSLHLKGDRRADMIVYSLLPDDPR